MVAVATVMVKDFSSIPGAGWYRWMAGLLQGWSTAGQMW